ncbi:MAG: hypothetical protein OHK005_19270 [Candidatus Methylacidiphilales bacterium]
MPSTDLMSKTKPTLVPELRLILKGRETRRGMDCVPHRHPFHELAVVTCGRCRWVLERGIVELRTGEALLLPPGVMHHEESDPGVRTGVWWLGFFIPSPGESFPVCARPIPAATAEPLLERLQTIHREVTLQPPWHEQRVALALQELTLLLRRPPVRPARKVRGLNPRQMSLMRTAAHHLEANLAEDVSIREVARIHGLSAPHFTTLFARCHGMSPKQFLQQARFRKARALLADARLSVKEVASLCGFGDPAHFSRQFRRATGRPPRAYCDS